MKRLALLICSTSLLFCSFALAESPPPNNAYPSGIVAMKKRIETCHHFAGEEPYDEERRKQIEKAMTDNKCEKLQEEINNFFKTKAIKKEYKDHIKQAIDQTGGYFTIPNTPAYSF